MHADALVTAEPSLFLLPRCAPCLQVAAEHGLEQSLAMPQAGTAPVGPARVAEADDLTKRLAELKQR